MSRSQQRRSLDLRQSQNVDRLAGGKTIGPRADSCAPKGKRVLSNKPSAVPRGQRVSDGSQTSSKASDLSPWRRAQSNAVRVSSACSSPVRPPLAAETTACTCSQINECVCDGYVPAKPAWEPSGRNVTKNHIRAAKNLDHSEFSSRQSTTPNDTVELRYYCDEAKCLVSCSRQGDLARHKTTRHGNTTYECSFSGCEFRYKRKDKLIKHTRDAHVSKSIECPPITYRSFVPVQAKWTLFTARDQVNSSLTGSHVRPRSEVKVFGPSSNGIKQLTSIGFRLLDAETAVPDERNPGLVINSDQDPVTQARYPEASASHLRTSSVHHVAIRRSRSLPKKGILEPRPVALEQASIRVHIGNLENAVEKAYEGLSERSTSTPPKLPPGRPNHSISSAGTQPSGPGGYNRSHTTKPHALSSVRFSSLALDGVPQEGDGSRSPAPPQRSTASWADVVRNASSAENTCSSQRQDDDEHQNDASGRNKGKRRRLNADGHVESFVCIGHHRGHPEEDLTIECETTLKEYFSQLE